MGTVQPEEHILSNKTQKQIGETNPFMIVSLLRPGKVYSYANFSSCLPVYKNRTLRSLGIDSQPIDCINADTVAKCITTLIHNTNDPNIHRILEGHDIEQYLSEEKVPFDSPEFDYLENNNADEENEYDDDDEDSERGSRNNFKMSIGFDDNIKSAMKTQRTRKIKDSRDESDKRGNKVM